MKSLKETINEDFKLNGKHKIVSHKNTLLLEEDPVKALCRMVFEKLHNVWSKPIAYKREHNIYDLFNRLISINERDKAIDEFFSTYMIDNHDNVTKEDILEVYEKNDEKINKFIMWSAVEIVNDFSPTSTLNEIFNKLYNKYVK